jgi:dTDP-3-amino-2,3,6-trideoxy-4-keto-D-glucose/dTDP-3-amino-3,4,6-trideoxy-alpha-D-glucose/dTDP-2,6-dideoxy-D-kanosamine transaminase
MQKKLNFLPEQYKKTSSFRINHNYLKQQFSGNSIILNKIKKLNLITDYTLGKEVDKFENKIKKLTNSKYAIGVGSGTDAITLSLKALGIGKGDEVITPSFTFYGTIGAIVMTGAKPVFVDIAGDLNIDSCLIEKAITKKTKAIVPVHWSGLICDMKKIHNLAKKYKLFIVEDACHAILSEREGKKAGFYADAACFSLHPLKNLNVWGDGGFVITNKLSIKRKLSLMRNHGLINRNICKEFAGNSRLDTIQAIVANELIKKINHITRTRIKNAKKYDEYLSKCKFIEIPDRHKNSKHVFHIYSIKVKKRNSLLMYLQKNGIDAKIHYPVPMHLQPAAKKLKLNQKNLKNTEATSKKILSLPVHEFITFEQIKYVSKKIFNFYNI